VGARGGWRERSIAEMAAGEVVVLRVLPCGRAYGGLIQAASSAALVWVLLYDNPVSANCYKVRLLVGLLGVEFERREVSVLDRSGRAEVLGGLSPSLNVPTVVLEDGRPLAESNAILWYFGDGTPLSAACLARVRRRAARARTDHCLSRSPLGTGVRQEGNSPRRTTTINELDRLACRAAFGLLGVRFRRAKQTGAAPRASAVRARKSGPVSEIGCRRSAALESPPTSHIP
jgi:glutathione S-transferase